MARLFGWAGTILLVDLSKGKIETEELSQEFARKYLGTNGFNAVRLFELVKPGIDALSPENVIFFGIGPLAATKAAGAGRVTIMAKSPLTDAIGHSSMGGFFGTELKRAGYDQIIISGKAEHPVYLQIHDDEVEIKDAAHLWGKTTLETDNMIKEELGDPHIPVLSIGQAGENLVRFACVRQKAATAGRTGMGAVMGSKNLKAITARGSKQVAIARPEEFTQIYRHLAQSALTESGSSNSFMHTIGTPGLMEVFFSPGMPSEGGAGVLNFQTNVFPGWEKISGTALKKEFNKNMTTCPNCPIACKISYTVDSGEFAGTHDESIEYGLTGCLGPGCGIDNLPAILKINELFSNYGIDDASGAMMMAWAMDCYDKGILTDSDFDGLPLKFGDYKAVIEMTHKMAKRQGFGNILAEGEKRAPEIVGRGSEKLMYHCKGSHFQAEDPRARKADGLQHHTSPRGADHLTADISRMTSILMTTESGKALREDPETMNHRSYKNKALVVKGCEDVTAAINALGICIRPASSVPFEVLAQMISAETGIDFSEADLLEIGERIFNVMKAFNSREGMTRKDDYSSVPEKWAEEPISDGPFKGETLELDPMLDEYYESRGWDVKTGLQTRKKLEQLGLSHIVEELEKAGGLA